MQYIITRMESTEGRFVSWRITASGDYYKTLLVLKDQDMKDLLKQIAEQDIEVFKNIKFQNTVFKY